MVHLITFELIGPRFPAERTHVENAIKALGPAYAFGPNAWLVESELTNRAICERIVPLLKHQDRIIATRIHRDWVTANVPQADIDWLSACDYDSAADRDPAVPRVPTVRG